MSESVVPLTVNISLDNHARWLVNFWFQIHCAVGTYKHLHLQTGLKTTGILWSQFCQFCRIRSCIWLTFILCTFYLNSWNVTNIGCGTGIFPSNVSMNVFWCFPPLSYLLFRKVFNTLFKFFCAKSKDIYRQYMSKPCQIKMPNLDIYLFWK